MTERPARSTYTREGVDLSMTECQARAACKKEGVAISGPFINIVDAILEHMGAAAYLLLGDAADELAADLAERIAE
mgnify:CR=1 FL=1